MAAFGCALIAAHAVAACAPMEQAARPEVAAPAWQGDAFVMADGARLPIRKWEAGAPTAIIIGVHGLNDYGNAFRLAGPWFAERGVTTYAYDQRGFGEAPEPGVFAGGDRLRRDLHAVIRLVRARHPDLPLTVVGLSMGGAVTMSALADPDAPPIDRVVLAAPGVWGYRSLPPAYRAGLWLGAHLFPTASFTAEGLGVVASDNRDALIANGRDPLFLKDTRTDLIYGVMHLMDDASESVRKLPTPLLYLYGWKDQVIPQEQTFETIAKLPPGARAVLYPDGWHMLLRDNQRAVVWQDMLAFIADPKAPMPSGKEQLASAGRQGEG